MNMSRNFCSLALLSALIGLSLGTRIGSSDLDSTQTERIISKNWWICNPVSKAAFAAAFVVAYKAPTTYPRCRSMTRAEWKLVGCDNPSHHRSVKICAPAVWGRVLGRIVGADAMALKNKILFRHGITRRWLFTTPRGRALVRHELAHIVQQSSVRVQIWISLYLRLLFSWKKLLEK